MAPVTRYGKGFSRDEVLAHQRALRAGPVNTTGFPALPVELFYEIISYFPTVKIPRYTKRISPEAYLEQARIIRALSQICRSLRSVFLPYLWQKIEACAVPDKFVVRRAKNPPWVKYLAVELVRQLEIVTIRDPTLAEYVKIVNVYLTSHSSDTVMDEFSRCLALFPNLHTIQMLGQNAPERDLSKAFKGKRFPSVRTVVLAPNAHQVLAACPEARLVISSSDHPFLIELMIKHCRKIECLHGFSSVDYRSFMKGRFIEKLTRRLPNTRNFILDTSNKSLTCTVVKQLAGFPKLESIQLKIQSNSTYNLPEVRELIRTAESILREKTASQRHLILDFPGSRHKISILDPL